MKLALTFITGVLTLAAMVAALWYYSSIKQELAEYQKLVAGIEQARRQ